MGYRYHTTEIHSPGRRGRRGSALTMDDEAESSRRAPPMTPPSPPPLSPAIREESIDEAILWAFSSRRAPPMTPPSPPPPSPAIREESIDEAILWAASRRRAPPMTPPPSPAIHEESIDEAILWAASDDCSSNTPDTDLLSLWVSNYSALPQPEAEEEPLLDVPTSLTFVLESSFPDLVDWNTTSVAVTQAPIVTEPLWMQLHTLTEGSVDDPSGLALGIQSPRVSISPLVQGNQSPNASILPLALGIQLPEASISPLVQGNQSPNASILPLALGIQLPEASISPLALGIQSPETSFGIQSAPASFSALQSITCTLPMAPPLGNFLSRPSPVTERDTSLGIQSAPTSFSALPSITGTLPMAPPLGNFLSRPSPVTERRSWSTFLSTPPPTSRHLLPHSASSSVNCPSSYPSPQTHDFFPAANTGYQHQLPDALAPVTLSTANANANSFAGFDLASQPPWSQTMVPCASWAPNQPWISNGENMKLPIPRHPRFLLPPAATMPEPLPLQLANFESSVENIPVLNATRDVPLEDHQQVRGGESSRPSRRKRSKLGVRIDNKLMFK